MSRCSSVNMNSTDVCFCCHSPNTPFWPAAKHGGASGQVKPAGRVAVLCWFGSFPGNAPKRLREGRRRRPADAPLRLTVCETQTFSLRSGLPTRKLSRAWGILCGRRSSFLFRGDSVSPAGVTPRRSRSTAAGSLWPACAEQTTEMLDPRGGEYGGSQTLAAGSSFMHSKGLLTHLTPPDAQPAYKKNTVRELLMKRRQTRSCSQDDNASEHRFKYSGTEALPGYTGPRLPGPPAPACSVPSAPENLHIPLQPGQVSLPAGAKLTLFHWQIKQEERRIQGVYPELLNTQDMDGDTFLHIAVAQGKRALAFVLAANMAPCGSLEIKERNGQTALHLAAATSQHMIVHDLLLHGAHINAQDHWGRSPLHVCAEKGHLLCLQSIWKALTCRRQPIDLEIFNYDGLTPLHAAVVSHNAVLKELRTRENACLTATMALVQKKHMYVECVKTMLDMGASFGTKDLKSGRTCLHMAAEEANLELFALFLPQPSALSTVNAKTFSGNTALHVLSSLPNHRTKVEAMKQLLRHGADPGSRNLENELPSQLVPAGPLGDKLKEILKGKCFHA